MILCCNEGQVDQLVMFQNETMSTKSDNLVHRGAWCQRFKILNSLITYS